MLDDIDTHLWVLEPEHPTRAQTMRRVAVGTSHSSIVYVCCVFLYFFLIWSHSSPRKFIELIFVVRTVKRVSLIIELSSTFPRLIPTLKFLGSETSIAPFQEKLTSNGSLWDPSKTTRENLERIFDVKFLKKETTIHSDDFTSECAICYTYILDNKIPEACCRSKLR
jgi:E3 ubiquitin-protein ligase FANCL